MLLSESLVSRGSRFWSVLSGKATKQAKAAYDQASLKRLDNIEKLKGMRRFDPSRKGTGTAWRTTKAKKRSAATRKGMRKRLRLDAQAKKTAYRAERSAMLKARTGVGAVGVGAGIAAHSGKKRREDRWRSRYRAMQAAQERAAILNARPDSIRIGESILSRLRAQT